MLVAEVNMTAGRIAFWPWLISHWTARVTGTLMVLLFFAFLFGEPPGQGQIRGREIVIFGCWFAVVSGLLAAWRWPVAGGGVVIAFTIGMSIAEPQLARAWPFQLMGAAGVLHLVSGWGARCVERVAIPHARAVDAVFWSITAVGLLLLANEMLLIQPLMTPPLRMPSPLAGSWRHGDVLFAIAPDGAVSGSVGTAAIASGRMSGNRSWFGRRLGWRTEYVIRGRLSDGRGFSALLNTNGDVLEGAVVKPEHTPLKLVRVPSPSRSSR
jgi:hypothetical protein